MLSENVKKVFFHLFDFFVWMTVDYLKIKPGLCAKLEVCWQGPCYVQSWTEYLGNKNGWLWMQDPDPINPLWENVGSGDS